MTVLLAGPSCLQAIRLTRQERHFLASNTRSIIRFFDAPTVADRLAATRLIGTATTPTHFAVNRREDRRQLKGARCHLLPSSFPAHSIAPLHDQFWTLSPEYLFLQAHDFLDDLSCIALGFELCGTYARRGTEAIEHNVLPVTNVQTIARFLGRAAKFRHIARARRNLKHVMDGSGSLRETQIALMIGLPQRHGGYGLRGAVLNDSVDLGLLFPHGTGAVIRRPDLSWPGAKVAVEYDSDEFHAERQKIARDAKRRTLLQAAGYSVIVITNDQMKSLAEMDRIAASLFQKLGKSPRCRTRGYEALKVALHRRILALDV